MYFVETITTALSELWLNKFRSILTTLGIIIAVTAVISVVSILQGMGQYMSQFIQGLGSDAIWVTPYISPDKPLGEASKVKLTYDDVMAIKDNCSSVKEIAPLLQRQVKLNYREKQTMVPLLGSTSAFQNIRNWYADKGRYFTESEMLYGKNVCILGRDVLDRLKAGEDILWQRIKIEHRFFKVIGLLEKKGSFLGQSQDNLILIPFGAAKKMFGARDAERISILAQAKDSNETKNAAFQIERVLRKRHNIPFDEPGDFKVSTQDQALEFFYSASSVTTLVLAGIVGISLIVGGIGIMNIMLVSVTERTKEIGILKALGAKNKDILVQFLIESLVLSLSGGLMGITLGIAIGYTVSALSPLPRAYVPLWAIFLSFLFSAAVGVFFGIYPAYKAAKLNPIEALRYE